jgi:cytochrome c553
MSAPTQRRFGLIATITVASIAVVAFFVGFLILPSATDPQATLWLRMCRAAGVVITRESEVRLVAPRAFTSVVMPKAAMRAGTADQIGHGATLALRCTGCHGAQGLSGANAPNLAGQYSEVIYKQQVDFQRGARSDAVMGAIVAPLSDQDMLDIAHYYAYLPRPTKDRAMAGAPPIVRVGDPMRNIAPCASCHGANDGKVGAPALEGEPKAYLKRQLSAFADGSRKNDANAAMRNEVRRLTPAEIEAVVDNYSDSPR